MGGEAAGEVLTKHGAREKGELMTTPISAQPSAMWHRVSKRREPV